MVQACKHGEWSPLEKQSLSRLVKATMPKAQFREPILIMCNSAAQALSIPQAGSQNISVKMRAHMKSQIKPTALHGSADISNWKGRQSGQVSPMSHGTGHHGSVANTMEGRPEKSRLIDAALR